MVRRITAKFMVAVMLSSSIVAVTPSIFPATVYAEQPIHTNLSAPIPIENKGTIELKTIFAVPSPEGQVVTFTLDVINTSNEEINFNKYWLRLKTPDMKGYPIRWVDQSKYMIYPGQKQTLMFYSVLPNTMPLSNINLRLVKWDTTLPSFERDLGELPIHAEVIPTLGRSLSKFIGLTNNQIEASVESNGITEGEKELTVSYTMKLVNKGQFAFTVPGYQYVLVTETGIAYPLSINENDSKDSGGSGILLPWIEKEVKLKGVVPSTVNLDNVALYVLHPHSGDKSGQIHLPVTVFRVFETVEEAPDTSEVIKFGEKTQLILKGDKDEESGAALTVTSIQRFPWDHRDLLSAKVEMKNTGDKVVSIPKLNGQFVLGNGYRVKADVLLGQEDRTHLYPGDSITYQLIGYMSYSSTINNAYVELKESDEAGNQKVIKSGKLPQITFTERDTQIAEQDIEQSYVIGEDGSHSSVQVGDLSTYKSTNGKFIVARLLVSNQETRGTEIPKLKAYFKTKEGVIYPAETTTIEKDNFPLGSSVMTFWTEFPEEVKQEELQLIIGEEIAEKGLKSGVSYQLEKYKTTGIGRMDAIKFYPYTVKFTNFFADDFIQFGFTFKKEKAFNYKANLGERKLIMQFTNSRGDVLPDEVEVELEGNSAWNGEKKLYIPKDKDGINQYQFTITIFDEYNGARREVAKEYIDMFSLFNQR